MCGVHQAAREDHGRVCGDVSARRDGQSERGADSQSEGYVIRLSA